MVETNCSCVQTFHLIKKLIHFCLFSAFLVLATFGLKDVLSGETTFVVSKIARPVTLPSFTICPFGHNQTFLDKSLLSQGVLTKKRLPFALNVSLWLQTEEDGKFTGFDLLNANVLHEQLNTTIDESWERYCKIYPPTTNLDSCVPCLTFRNPSIAGEFTNGLVSAKLLTDFQTQKLILD